MNKLLLLLLYLVFVYHEGNAQPKERKQQVALQAGQVFSEIRFVDSFGSELQNLQPVNHFFMLAEYRSSIFSEQLNNKLFGSVGLGFNGYGSNGSDRVLNNYYEWDLSYLGLFLGLDYEVFTAGSFTGLINIKASSELLVRGSQVLNTQVYDIKGEDDFDTPITFFRGGLGVKFQLTSDAAIFAQYMIGKSYSFFDQGTSELNIIAQNFGIGLFTNMSYTKMRKPRWR